MGALPARFFADSVNRISPSQTIGMATKARELKAKGRDVISLSAGEPDFDTPDNIKEAAVRALKEGKTKYTDVDGIPELKAAIVAKFKRENGLDYKPSQISVGTGGKQVLYNALLCTLNPGDEVVIPAPCWVSYADIVLLGGGKPVFAPCRIEDGYRLKPEVLDKAITAQDQVVRVQRAVQPVGRRLQQGGAQGAHRRADAAQERPRLGADRRHVRAPALRRAATFYTPAQVEPALYERTLTMNGFSKAYCMTGWRLGYAGGPEPLIKTMCKLQSQSTSNPSSITQWAGVEALNGPQDFIPRNKAGVQGAARPRGVDAEPGQGHQVPQARGRVLRLSLLRGRDRQDQPQGHEDQHRRGLRAGAAGGGRRGGVQGAAFAMSPYFRISYATSNAELEDACGAHPALLRQRAVSCRPGACPRDPARIERRSKLRTGSRQQVPG